MKSTGRKQIYRAAAIAGPIGSEPIASREWLEVPRFAGAPAPREEPAASVHRGSNQSDMRAFNERLLLSLVRRHGAIAKSDVARLTGLSAQTASVIMRQLEADDLILRGEPVRGRVGQPSVPLSLNPEGAFFLGLKIGRRSADFVLVDFLGHILIKRHETYAYPMPEQVVGFARKAVEAVTAQLGKRAKRIAGLGLAIPFELWNWAEEAGAPAGAMDAWRTLDLRDSFAAFCPWPIYVQNDATAACGAELAFGTHQLPQDFVYFYVGTLVGGGVVLNGSLYPGRTGNAGAVGSMPVPGPAGRSVQLIDVASLVVLERTLRASGVDPSPLWDESGDWEEFEDAAKAWLAGAARGLAHAIVAACSTVDFGVAIIDGGLPEPWRARLVDKVRREASLLDTQGIALPQLATGTLGPVARALGGASLPLFDRFLIDHNVLMREGRIGGA